MSAHQRQPTITGRARLDQQSALEASASSRTSVGSATSAASTLPELKPSSQLSEASLTDDSKVGSPPAERSRRQSSLVVQPPELLGSPSAGKDVVPFRGASKGQLCRVSMRQYDVYTSQGAQQAGQAVAHQRRFQQAPPIIIVEPRNDDSLQCDCRGCQFFSGWCCTPCVLLIIMIIVIVAIMAPGSHNSHRSEAPPATSTTTGDTSYNYYDDDDDSSAAAAADYDQPTSPMARMQSRVFPSWLDIF